MGNNTKTKEDILSNYEYDVHYYGESGRRHILKAMDEYAKQEAINFQEWAAGEDWRPYDGSDVWINLDQGRKVVGTKELYEIFKNKK